MYEEEKIMPYGEFAEKLKQYMQLYDGVKLAGCPQFLLMKRDELDDEIREAFCDAEDNLTRWIKGKPCTFVSPETRRRVDLVVGHNAETLYHFLVFCREFNMTGKVSDDHKTYLAYLLSKDAVGGSDGNNN